MATRTRKQIEFLYRLQELSGCLVDIMEFLHQEALMSKDEIKKVQIASCKAKELEAHLNLLFTQNKLQMLEYRWELLPIERLNLCIVTDRVVKNFEFNS